MKKIFEIIRDEHERGIAEYYQKKHYSGIIESIIGALLFYVVVCPMLFYSIWTVVQSLITGEVGYVILVVFIYVGFLFGILRASAQLSAQAIHLYGYYDNHNKPFRNFMDLLNRITVSSYKIIVVINIILVVLLFIS